MKIEKLRKLWRLSQIPTHSPNSLKELHQLVREAAPFLIPPDLVAPCNVCVNKDKCIDHGDIARACICGEPRFMNFEMEMESP